MKVLLVTGDRYAKDLDKDTPNPLYNAWKHTVEDKIVGVFDPQIVVHGAAKGIDSIAEFVCTERFRNAPQHQRQTIPMPYMKALGPAGGPQRNKRMVYLLKALQDTGHICTVYAFHDDIESSKGTKDCVTQSSRAGLSVVIYAHDGTILEFR